MSVDVDAVAERSIERVVERLPEWTPCRQGDSLVCPFCVSELVVRRTILGTLDPVPETGEQPHVDGVQLKCAGDTGCGFRPDFDVPLTRGHGYWPDLDHGEEFERERELRDGKRVIDMGYTPDDDGDGLEGRLRALGYLD